MLMLCFVKHFTPAPAVASIMHPYLREYILCSFAASMLKIISTLSMLCRHINFLFCYRVLWKMISDSIFQSEQSTSFKNAATLLAITLQRVLFRYWYTITNNAIMPSLLSYIKPQKYALVLCFEEVVQTVLVWSLCGSS